MNRRSRSEETGGGGDMKELRQIRRGKVLDGFECKQKDFEVYAKFHRKPVELLQNRGDMVNEGGSGDNSSCSVLNQLEFMEVLVR